MPKMTTLVFVVGALPDVVWPLPDVAAHFAAPVGRQQPRRALRARGCRSAAAGQTTSGKSGPRLPCREAAALRANRLLPPHYFQWYIFLNVKMGRNVRRSLIINCSYQSPSRAQRAFVKPVRPACARGWKFGHDASLPSGRASRQGARSASEMQSCWLDKACVSTLPGKNSFLTVTFWL